MIIRDAVHGDIHLDPIAERIVDTPAFQRLRGVKQLGSASLVYPSCVHTRFEHSLGVYWTAKKMIESLRQRNFNVDSELQFAIPLAALLHDIAHIPFGHTLEDEVGLFQRHDSGPRMEYYLEGQIDNILQEEGIRSLVRVLLGLDPIHPEIAWAQDVVSGTVDADMLDYLRRDALFAGLRQNYDDRVIDSFGIVEGRLAVWMVKEGRDRPDVRSEFFHLLNMRYYLTERVYYHHAKVTSSAMVARAVEMAMQTGLQEEDLYWLSDETLLHVLVHGEKMEAGTREIALRVRERRLLKRGISVSEREVGTAGKERLVSMYFQKPTPCKTLEEEIASYIGCPSNEVIVHCQAPTNMKDVSALCVTANGTQYLREAMANSRLEINVLENRYQDLWRLDVLVPEEHKNKVAASWPSLLGM